MDDMKKHHKKEIASLKKKVKECKTKTSNAVANTRNRTVPLARQSTDEMELNFWQKELSDYQQCAWIVENVMHLKFHPKQHTGSNSECSKDKNKQTCVISRDQLYRCFPKECIFSGMHCAHEGDLDEEEFVETKDHAGGAQCQKLQLKTFARSGRKLQHGKWIAHRPDGKNKLFLTPGFNQIGTNPF